MNQKSPTQPVSRRDKIAKANSTVFIATAVAAVIVVFSVISVRFLWQRKSYNDRVITAKTTARNDLQTNLENLDKLAEQFPALNESTTTNASTILHALPPTYDYAALATSVEFLARQAGVTLTGGLGEDQSSSALTSASVSSPQEVPLDLQVTGSYENVVKFVQNLEVSIRPIVVTSANYSGGTAGISARISATTYYQPARNLDVQKEQVR